MNITIPDPIAESLAAEGQDPARAALEAIAIEGYRSDRLSEYEVQQLLDFSYFEQVHGFFKEHGVYLHYSMEDLEHDLAEARRLALKPDLPEHRPG
jgi:predicted HTH domain antitoxin